MILTNSRWSDFVIDDETTPRKRMIDSKDITTTATTTVESNKGSTSGAATPWASRRLKDPRIVRVSGGFGGKDRHSKVCTVRGLRDRRIRLSIPTAIQLYDLQDRLGLNQPSKVVDWLLNAAKHGIDKLPPLQVPPGFFTHHFQNLLEASRPMTPKHSHLRLKDAPGDSSRSHHRNQGFVRKPDHNHPKNRGFLQNPNHNDCRAMPVIETGDEDTGQCSNPYMYNPFVNPNLALIGPPQTLGSMVQIDRNFSLMQLPSYQPGIATQPYFPWQICGSTRNNEFESRESRPMLNFSTCEVPNSSLQVFQLAAQPVVGAFPFTVSPNLLCLQKHDEMEQNEGNNFPS